MSDLKFLSQTILSLALMVLAAAIFYFAYTIANTLERIPAITKSVSEITLSVNEITTAIQPIVELAPKIISESEQIRAQTDAVVKQSQVIIDKMPSVINEVELVRQESEKIRQETEAIRAELPAMMAELTAYRKLAPQVLAETQEIRASLPVILDRAEVIVTQLNSVATNAGENAVTGFFTGLVKAPVNLMTGVTDLVIPAQRKLSAGDRKLIEDTLEHFVNTSKVGDTQTFSSDDKKLSGSVKLESDVVRHNDACRILILTIRKNGHEEKPRTINVCRDKQGKWSVESKEN